LRDASALDAPSCGPLLFSTWPELYCALLGSEARAAVALADLFTAPDNTFSFDRSRVAEQEGRIIGLAASYPADEGHHRATGSLRPALRTLGPIRFARVIWTVWRISDASIGVDPRHFYLANVAVVPEARGLGTGRLLLQDAERRTLSSGRRTLSLEVDGTNERARSFYERAGYRVVEVRESPVLGKLTGCQTRLLMTKSISP
jgi:ribosomal protein S18 acetylase RimI-like enzyme